MVKNSYCYSPHLDLKFWTIDKINTKTASRDMQKWYITTSPVNVKEFWQEMTPQGKKKVTLAEFCVQLWSLFYEQDHVVL